jgi:hypothetical protein
MYVSKYSMWRKIWKILQNFLGLDPHLDDRSCTDVLLRPAGFRPNERFQDVSNNTKGVFRYFKILKILQDFPSHWIFERIYGALNIDKK